jgi:hypothetical protein
MATQCADKALVAGNTNSATDCFSVISFVIFQKKKYFVENVLRTVFCIFSE